MSETLCFSDFFFFFDSSVYKEFALDYIFDILKLNLISFNWYCAHFNFNELVICYTCTCTLKSLLRRHIDIKNLDLEASLRRTSCKYIKIFRASTERSNIATFFDQIAGCASKFCHFIKTLVDHSFLSQSIFITATCRYIFQKLVLKNQITWKVGVKLGRTDDSFPLALNAP